jgi:hypothetical protein
MKAAPNCVYSAGAPWSGMTNPVPFYACRLTTYGAGNNYAYIIGGFEKKAGTASSQKIKIKL